MMDEIPIQVLKEPGKTPESKSYVWLSRYKYIEYLLEHRPCMDMSDEELEHFAPWGPDVQAACAKGVN